jgi:hypothetical protein
LSAKREESEKREESQKREESEKREESGKLESAPSHYLLCVVRGLTAARNLQLNCGVQKKKENEYYNHDGENLVLMMGACCTCVGRCAWKITFA